AFASIWEGLEQWPYVRKELLKAQHFALRDRIPIKKAFSFTSDLKVYETCSRQYQYFRYYDFTPSRSAEMFFGRLVHQTIEDIHRWVLAGQSLKLIDFKSQPRPAHDDARLATYYKQLCIYAYILEQRYGRTPERLMLYWTGEERKADALMVFPYHREVVADAGVHFDQIVTQILL